MASITMQRDLVITLKRETLLNVGILSKLHPMSVDLSRQIFKENILEKLTQNVFNHLAYYLVTIIDPTAAAALPWPLYDSKSERTYRNELAVFVTEYSNKGLLSPVMSSYLVNPGCFKVTFLVFQLSQLAVQRVLESRMVKNNQRTLYDDMTKKYKSQNCDGFIECIEKETTVMLSKFSNYLNKRHTMEKIAQEFRKKIEKMEETFINLKTQEYLDNLVDGFVNQQTFDVETRKEILKIKNVNVQSQFFENWLEYVDTEVNKIENEWGTKTSPFLDICRKSLENSEALIARHTGEADKKLFTVEYNPTTDEICTNDLQAVVNSEQKYILKNIVKDDILIFPNLIRGFLISISFILKNMEIGDEICRFNEYLESGRRSYAEIISAMRMLVERVMNAESRLQQFSATPSQSLSVRDLSEIPPVPDLSDLKMNREYHSQVLFDTFTPLNLNKHQFNLRKKMTNSFAKPMSKSLLVTPFHHVPREDFMKSFISCRVSAYDRPNRTQNMHNMSIISQANSRGNETIAECSSGFTKQQICRLLSTKKSSSSKKYKFKAERPTINVKKGGLFNESTFSNDSIVLTRSHSSPNLYENREKRSLSKARARKLSIMKEDSPSLLEVSGIAALERESNHSTPQGVLCLESSRKLIDSSSMPIIAVTPETNEKLNNIANEPVDLNKEIENVSIESETVLPQRVSWKQITEEKRESVECKETKSETPKTNVHLVRKTSSLEKIINRFKKVRASVLPMDCKDDYNTEIKPIAEEKENLNTVNVDVFTANRILLPDLLSPSCSILTQNSNDYVDQICSDSDEDKPRKPRESLGAALGVDHTFLDQFDLID